MDDAHCVAWRAKCIYFASLAPRTLESEIHGSRLTGLTRELGGSLSSVSRDKVKDQLLHVHNRPAPTTTRESHTQLSRH